jgi:hypothetical protein
MRREGAATPQSRPITRPASSDVQDLPTAGAVMRAGRISRATHARRTAGQSGKGAAMVKPAQLRLQSRLRVFKGARKDEVSIAMLQAAVSELWEELVALADAYYELEQQMVMNPNEIRLKAGDASITLKRDGAILITGKDITIKGSGKVSIKADSDLVMKGRKVLDN